MKKISISTLMKRSVLAIVAFATLMSPLMVMPRAAAAGQFTTRDGNIIGPDGAIFTPVGANVGTVKSYDWRGIADGHAADAKAWGWNAIRLNLYTSGQISWSYVASYGYDAFMNQVDALVQEYTNAGIVVMLDVHDDPLAEDQNGQPIVNEATMLNDMQRFLTDAAAKYKNNPYVWFNTINEPKYQNDGWYTVQDRLIGAVRATGNTNPVVVDAPSWGQDLGPVDPWFTGSKFAYDATMAPKLASKYGNLVLSQHNYGAYSKYTTDASLQAYIDAVHGAGLPLLFGEYGYTIDGSTTAGGYQLNKDGATAVFDISLKNHVGSFWWSATHGDNYSLKKSGNAFYADGGPNANLSEAGQKLWDLGHANASAPPVTPPTTTPTPTPTNTVTGKVTFTAKDAFSVDVSNAQGNTVTMTWDNNGWYQVPLTTNSYSWWSGANHQTNTVKIVVTSSGGQTVFSTTAVNPFLTTQTPTPVPTQPTGTSSGSWATDGSSFGISASNYPSTGTMIVNWQPTSGNTQVTTQAMSTILQQGFWSGGGRTNVKYFWYVIKDSGGKTLFTSNKIKSPLYP